MACAAGDTAARGLLGKLLQAGCAPYFKMLERWLCEGVLDDPFGEFMVQENPVSLPLLACAISICTRAKLRLSQQQMHATYQRRAHKHQQAVACTSSLRIQVTLLLDFLLRIASSSLQA